MPAVATRGPQGLPQLDTYQAAAANQLRGLAVVQGADDNHVATVAAANANAIGVQQETSLYANDPIAIVLRGEATAIAGGVLAAGAYVITDNQGRFVASAAIGDFVIGRALSSAAVAGDEFILLVQPFIR